MSKADRQRRHRAGLRAELIGLLYFSLKFYRLIAWRYKTPVGEIDLILRRGRRLVFVEVKARRTHADAAYAVHATNQRRVVQAAQFFLSQHPAYTDFQMQFDVLTIAWYRLPKHIAQAFDATS